jgi:hypothetical protein
VCAPERVGHGVVEIAMRGGFVAAREPTRQIPAAHRIGQRPRWGVSRFGWRIAGVADLAHGGALHSGGQQRRGHHPATNDERRRCRTEGRRRPGTLGGWRGAEGRRHPATFGDRRGRDGRGIDVRLCGWRGFFDPRRGGGRGWVGRWGSPSCFGAGGRDCGGVGDHVDHRGGRWSGIAARGGAVGVAAFAGQLMDAGGIAVNASLRRSPSVRGSSSHTPAGHLLDALLKHHRVWGTQPRPHAGEARLIAG